MTQYKVTIATVHHWDRETLIDWARATTASPLTPMDISDEDLINALDRIDEAPTVEIANDAYGKSFLKIERA